MQPRYGSQDQGSKWASPGAGPSSPRRTSSLHPPPEITQQYLSAQPMVIATSSHSLQPTSQPMAASNSSQSLRFPGHYHAPKATRHTTPPSNDQYDQFEDAADDSSGPRRSLELRPPPDRVSFESRPSREMPRLPGQWPKNSPEKRSPHFPPRTSSVMNASPERPSGSFTHQSSPLRKPEAAQASSPYLRSPASFSVRSDEPPTEGTGNHSFGASQAPAMAMRNGQTPERAVNLNSSRDGIPSPSSIASMGSSMRGRRAPAPAALDLSPRRNAVGLQAGMRDRYGDIGATGGESGAITGRRFVTDTALARTGSRPLPQPPVSNGQQGIYGGQPGSALPPGADRPRFVSAAGPLPYGSASPSDSSNRNEHGDSNLFGRVAPSISENLLSRRTHDERDPPDTFLRASPNLPNAAAQNSALSPSISQPTAFSPVTPEFLDPANIDRRNLVGVGELATPRWGQSPNTSFRTASVPLAYSTEPVMPQSTPQTSVPSRNWSAGQNGLGLGVGVGLGMTQNVREESPPKRGRHRSASQTSPPRPLPSTSAPPEQSHSDLLSLNSLANLSFDSSEPSILASTLGVPRDERFPPQVSVPRDHRSSVPPPPPSASAPLIPELRSHPIHQSPFAAAPQVDVSPGSARSRIYARRASRQAAANLAAHGNETPASALSLSHTASAMSQTPYNPSDTRSFRQPGSHPTTPGSASEKGSPNASRFFEGPILEQKTTKFSPPNSADSNQPFPGLKSRRTPPTKSPGGDGTPKARHSPGGTSHHDILRHFAPKDFSHLPPSPSTASIDKFLRGSAAVTTPPGPTNTTVQPTSFFQMPASSSKGSLQRSDSGKVKNIVSSAAKAGWEGRDVGPGTEEALRKLDGLSLTPGKKTPKGKGSTGPATTTGNVASRPGTPPPARGRTPVTEKKVLAKPSSGSLKDLTSDSPLNAWIELAADGIPDVPGIPSVTPAAKSRSVKTPTTLLSSDPTRRSPEKRGSASSASVTGSTIQDPASQVTTTNASTPTSASGRMDKTGRRSSGGSDVSSHNDLAASDAGTEKKVEGIVPPVPPLPKSYQSMRQSISTTAGPSAFAPQQDRPPATTPPGQDIQSPDSTHSAVQSEGSSYLGNQSIDNQQQPSGLGLLSSGSIRRPRMSKKWSFSALNFRHFKDSSPKDVVTSPGKESATSGTSARGGEAEKTPETPWQEVEQTDFFPDGAPFGQSSVDGRSKAGLSPGTWTFPTPLPKSASTNKRLTPSSKPFFRRSSSSSIGTKLSNPPESGSFLNNLAAPQRYVSGPAATSTSATAGPPRDQSQTFAYQDGRFVETTPPDQNDEQQRAPSTAQQKRSVLGMSIPSMSMLRVNSIKRNVSSQQLPQPGEHGEIRRGEGVKAASTGWSGRKRGKTVSISNDALTKSASNANMQPPPPPETARQLRPKPSIESSLSSRESIQSDYSESTLNGGTVKTLRPGLPSITGSPALRQTSSGSIRTAEVDRSLPSVTPTRIPRASNGLRNGSPGSITRGTMPPPPSTYLNASQSSSQNGPKTSKELNSTASMADLGKGNVSEFGSINKTQSTPRQESSGSHRAHLLGPMGGVKTDGKRAEKPAREPLVRVSSGQVIPPSRRNMPVPATLPNSTVTAPTAASLAKRASREQMLAANRPGVHRRDSKDTSSGGATPSGQSEQSSPIKPSKSAHSKLTASAASSKIPTSASVGASAVSKKAPGLPASPSMSPAEDEESVADAEMQAYVARRRARKAAGKKEDLTDVNEFPEDTDPRAPITQRAFVTKNLASMSDYERKEVLDFDHIYFTPSRRISRPPLANGAMYNHSYDDERGDYIVVPGDHMCYRYEVVSILGKGSFGQVVQCRDHKTGQSAAVKIIPNKKRFHAQALVEVKILQQLVEWDPEDKHGVIRMTEHFYFRGHLCIVTELLSINLYELIKANQFAGFSTHLIRRFTTQMLASLQLMRSHRIVHCDLKPENILLCHPIKSGIKVIDFGSSCHETEKVYTYIQSRFYRSPEVILGMNYAMAIDMWSLGCILAELYTGVPIFPGENEQEQLACIMEVLGVPDRDMVQRASRRKLFFDATGAPRPFVNAKGKRRRPNTKTLASALRCNDEHFVDFIAKCLTWDPERRLKPQSALRHPFIIAGRRRPAPPPAVPSTLRVSSNRMSDLVNGSALVPNGGLVSSSGSGWSLTGKKDRDSLTGKKDKDLTMSSSKKESSKMDGKDKSGLLISPPTPLMARSGTGKVAHVRNGSLVFQSAHS